MDLDRVRVSIEDRVATVTLGNPPDGMMDEAMEHQLHATVLALEEDPQVAVVVLTGAQAGIFVKHYDVSVLLKRGEKLAAKGISFTPDRPIPKSPIHELLDTIERSAKPYIAAINGTAMGGGFELSLACDIRLVQAGDFDLGLPEINLGILPGAGGTQRLTRLIGAGRALQYMLLGRTMTPQQAVDYGLALTSTDRPVLAEAQAVARQLVKKSPRALQHIKRLVHSQSTSPSDVAHATERTLFCDLMVSDIGLERMREWDAGVRDIRDQD